MRRGRTLAGPPYLKTAGGAHLRVISLDLRPIHLQPLTYGFQGHLPSLGRGAPWSSRRETCKLRSHPHPSRPSVVPPYPFCPFGTFPPDSGNRPSPLKGEGSGGRPLRRIQKPSFPFVGAGHWPAHRFMQRVQEAAPYGSAPVAPARHTQAQMWNRNSGNFFNHRAQWPGGNLDRHSDFARRKYCKT